MTSIAVAPRSRVSADVTDGPAILLPRPRFDKAVYPEALLTEQGHDADARNQLVEEYIRCAAPQKHLSDDINHHRYLRLDAFYESCQKVHEAILRGIPTIFGTVYCRLVAADGTVLLDGLQSHHILTTVGATRIRMVMDGSDAASATNAKYHALGTGSTTPAAGQTALVAELNTEYVVNGQRQAGSQGQGASVNIYASDAVTPIDTAPGASVQEFGLFDDQTRGNGHMFDRSAIGPLSPTAGQNVQTGYDLTIVAGS